MHARRPVTCSCMHACNIFYAAIQACNRFYACIQTCNVFYAGIRSVASTVPVSYIVSETFPSVYPRSDLPQSTDISNLLIVLHNISKLKHID